MLVIKNRSQVWKAFKQTHARFQIKDSKMVDWLKDAYWSLFQEEGLPQFSPRNLKVLDDDINSFLIQIRRQWKRSNKDDDMFKKDFMNMDIVIDLTDNDIDMTGDNDIDMTRDNDMTEEMETDQDELLLEDNDQDQLEMEEDELDEEDLAEDEGVPGPSKTKQGD